MSELKIDGAAVYFFLQCIAGVVRGLAHESAAGASSEAFLQALRANFVAQMNHPDTLSYEEDEWAEQLLELFHTLTNDPSIRIASLLSD